MADVLLAGALWRIAIGKKLLTRGAAVADVLQAEPPWQQRQERRGEHISEELRPAGQPSVRLELVHKKRG